MTKTFSLIFLFLFLVSCNQNTCPTASSSKQEAAAEKAACPPVVETPAPVVVKEPEPVEDTSGEVPALASTWDADIYLVNFSRTQEDKILKAVELMKKVIASKEFRDGILNHTYQGKKTFVDNAGFSNAQIYQKLLDGAEELLPTKNNTMNVELELYYQKTSTIGYTYPDTVRIWMNTKYFNNYTAVEVCDNLTHEWLHKLGFDHAKTWSKSRDSSVPYAIGYLMEKLAAKYQ